MLVSGNALKAADKNIESIEQEIKTAGIRLILLEDGEENFAYKPTIKKYQSARKVYRELMEVLDEEGDEYRKLISVYSPASGWEAPYKHIAEIEAERGDVLIVPLTEFSVQPEAMSDAEGLGEWFYYIKQSEKEFPSVYDYTYEADGMDYIRGFRTVYDMEEVSLEGWRLFFEKGLKGSKYHTIILIFDRLPVSIELFLWCDIFYVYWGKDGYAALRKRAFEKMLQYLDTKELLDKMVEV